MGTIVQLSLHPTSMSELLKSTFHVESTCHHRPPCLLIIAFAKSLVPHPCSFFFPCPCLHRSIVTIIPALSSYSRPTVEFGGFPILPLGSKLDAMFYQELWFTLSLSLSLSDLPSCTLSVCLYLSLTYIWLCTLPLFQKWNQSMNEGYNYIIWIIWTTIRYPFYF